MLVRDYMTPDPLVVSTNETVKWIAELIRDHRIRQVPVIDRANRLVGIVTDRDIRSADVDDDGKGIALIAEDIMTVDLVTIGPGEELLEAAERLQKHHFGALPVVVGDKVVGMITRGDLLRRLIELLKDPAHQDVHHYESPYAF